MQMINLKKHQLERVVFCSLFKAFFKHFRTRPFIFIWNRTCLLHVLSSCLITVLHNGNPVIHKSYIERIHKKLELHFQSKCEHDHDKTSKVGNNR